MSLHWSKKPMQYYEYKYTFIAVFYALCMAYLSKIYGFESILYVICSLDTTQQCMFKVKILNYGII